MASEIVFVECAWDDFSELLVINLGMGKRKWYDYYQIEFFCAFLVELLIRLGVVFVIVKYYFGASGYLHGS